MTTSPAGAGWTSPATWMSTSGQSSVSTLSVTLTGAIAQYAGHVCTGASPSRAHGLPARTAARRSSDGERRERIPAQCVSAHASDMNAVVHSAIHTSQPLQSLKRLLAPGVPRWHLRRLPAPMRLHRLQRSAPPGHPDGQSHTPRTARILLPKTCSSRHAVNTATYLRHRQPGLRRGHHV